MDIKSIFFDDQSIDPSTIISFPNGIPGFEDHKRFKLFHQEGDTPLVYWLQSVDDESLGFSVAQPSDFNINYNFTLNDEEEAILGIEDTADVLILIILHKELPDQPGAVSSLKTYALSMLGATSGQPVIKGALRGPLVINSAKRIGLQKVLNHIEQNITLTEVA